MTNPQEQQAIPPERQIAASQVGVVFNSLHEYLRSLEPKLPDPTSGELRSALTEQLKFAHCRIDEAAMWAIKSVLTFGTSPPAAMPAPPAGPTPPPPADEPTGSDALPPTTPAESV
jgi:hypothetical protein